MFEVGKTVKVKAVGYSPRLVAYIPLNGKVGTVIDAGHRAQMVIKGIVTDEWTDGIQIKFDVTPDMVHVDQYTHKFHESELQLVEPTREGEE